MFCTQAAQKHLLQRPDHATNISDAARVLAPQDRSLVDGGGAKPAYNLRTLCRALEYARAALPVYGLQRSLYDGCAMAFLTQLAPGAAPALERLLQAHILGAGVKLKVGPALPLCTFRKPVCCHLSVPHAAMVLPVTSAGGS